MDPDELEPRRQTPAPRDLDRMSIEELRNYIAELEAEIARVRGKIDAKKAHLAGADSLFRKS
jgi:uncharacterized small protein (DUF1192 family)